MDNIDILLNALLAIRNNASTEEIARLTDGKISKSDLFRLTEDMEDAINASAVDYLKVKQELEHFLKTDKYWVEWAKK